MPRFVINSPAEVRHHDKLVKRLAQELESHSPTDLQPLILEERIDATGSRHVYAIWDKWKDLSDDERSQVIVEAYSQTEGPAVAEQITIAAGLTPIEALSLGLLPWKVVRKGKKTKMPVSPDLQKQLAAMEAERAESRNTLLGKSGKELRYARAEDADDARKRLEAAAPGFHWMVVKEEQQEA